jgi:hypothetical protein
MTPQQTKYGEIYKQAIKAAHGGLPVGDVSDFMNHPVVKTADDVLSPFPVKISEAISNPKSVYETFKQHSAPEKLMDIAMLFPMAGAIKPEQKAIQLAYKKARGLSHYSGMPKEVLYSESKAIPEAQKKYWLEKLKK